MSKKLKPLPAPPEASARLYVEMPPAEVRFFRYLLEGVDNLAYTSVVDRRIALLKVVFSPHQEEELRSVLKEIGQSMAIKVINPPLS